MAGSIDLKVSIDNKDAVRQFKELQKTAKTVTSNIVTDADRVDVAIHKIGSTLSKINVSKLGDSKQIENILTSIKTDLPQSVVKRIDSMSKDAFGNMSQKAQQLAKDIQNDITSLRQLEQVQNAVDDAYESGKVSLESYLSAQARLAVLHDEMSDAILNNEQALRKEVAGNKLAEDSIVGLQAKVTLLTTEYMKLTQVQREGAQGNALLKEITDVQTRLQGATASMNQYAKATGSKFNGLSFSIQQIARELPVLAMSPQMFFMAISNNLPIFADELSRARKEYQAMVDAGKTGIPVWKQVAKSLLSWQTALVGGITLLTVYGDEIVDWVANIFTGKDAIDSFSESHAKMISGMANEVAQVDKLFNALRNTTKGTKEYNDAQQAIIDKYGPYLRGMVDEEGQLRDLEAAYNAVANAVRNVAKAKGLEQAQADAIENLNKQWDKYSKDLYEAFTSKFGEENGAKLLNEFAKGIASGITKLTPELDAIYSQFDKGIGFTADIPDVMYRLREEFTKTFGAEEAESQINDFLLKIVNGVKEFEPAIQAIYDKLDGNKEIYGESDIERLQRVTVRMNELAGITNKLLETNKENANSLRIANAIYADIEKKENEGPDSLIERAQKKLKEVEAMSEATEADLAKKNRLFKEVTDEIKRLRNLGIEQDEQGSKPLRVYEAEREAQEIRKLQADIEFSVQQARINAMADGLPKILAQNELNYQQEKIQLEAQKEDYLRAIQNYERAIWEARNPDWEKEGLQFTPTTLALPENIQSVFSQMSDIAYRNFERQNEEAIAKQREQLNTLLKEFETYEQARSRIQEEYVMKLTQMYDENGDLKDGFTQDNVEELERQATESINALDEVIAQRQDTYMEWAEAILDMGIGKLKQELTTVEELLKAAEFDGTSGNDKAVLRAQIKALKAQIKAQGKDKGSYTEWKDTAQAMRAVSQTAKEVINGIEGIDDETKNAINSMLNLAEAATTLMDAIESFKAAKEANSLSGMFSSALGMIGPITTGVTTIISLFDRSAKKREKQQQAEQERLRRLKGYWDSVNYSIEKNIDLLDRLAGADYYAQIEKAQAKLEEAMRKSISEMYSTPYGAGEIDNVINHLMGSGVKKDKYRTEIFAQKYPQTFAMLQQWADTVKSGDIDSIIALKENEELWKLLPENIKEATDRLIEYKEQSKELQEQIDADLLQTTSSALEDAIIEGMKAGKSGVDDLGSYFEEVMRDALIHSFVIDELRNEIDEFYKDYSEAYKSDGLDAEEIEALRQAWNELLQKAKDQAESIENTLGAFPGEDTAEREGASRGIASISQDSADEMNGRMTVIQQHTFDIKGNTDILVSQGAYWEQRWEEFQSYNAQVLLYLGGIRDNTQPIQRMASQIEDIATRGVKLREQ